MRIHECNCSPLCKLKAIWNPKGLLRFEEMAERYPFKGRWNANAMNQAHYQSLKKGKPVSRRLMKTAQTLLNRLLRERAGRQP